MLFQKVIFFSVLPQSFAFYNNFWLFHYLFWSKIFFCTLCCWWHQAINSWCVYILAIAMPLNLYWGSTKIHPKHSHCAVQCGLLAAKWPLQTRYWTISQQKVSRAWCNYSIDHHKHVDDTKHKDIIQKITITAWPLSSCLLAMNFKMPVVCYLQIIVMRCKTFERLHISL